MLRGSDLTDGEPAFGTPLAISGDLAVIGAPFRRDGVNEKGPMPRGGVHVFDLADPRHPVRTFRFSPSDGQWTDWFGMSAVIEGDRIVIGAPQDYSWGGKAFLYQGPRD